MKAAILLVLILSAYGSSYAQGSLSGFITDANNEPIGGAMISVKQQQSTRKTTTDSTGAFRLDGLTADRAAVSVSALGFELVQEWILIRGTTSFNKVMLVKSSSLQSVEVLGRTARNYHSDYSFSATRTAILNQQLPQTINTITKELMKDRQNFQLSDAVKLVPGVIPSSFYNQYAIRGISQNEEGQVINGMRTRQYYFLQPLTANIERVEVLKGPASATFASVDPGGTINLVTKKPLDQQRRELFVSAGSFSTLRGAIDFTGPLNKEKTLLYRFNGAFQQAQSYRDLVRNNALLISPSLSYLPDSNTAINVELIFSDMTGNLDRGQPIFGAVAGKTDLNSTPISLNLGAASDYFRSKDLVMTTSFSHRFSEAISFNAAYMKQTWQEDLQEHRTTNAYAISLDNQPVNSLVNMQYVQRKQNWNVDNVQAYFNFKFSTGKLRHELLAGADLSSWRKTKGGGQNAARGYLLKDGSVVNSFVAANAASYQTITYNGRIIPKPNVSYFDLVNPGYTIRNTSDYNLNVRTPIPAALTTNHAIYIQEQLRWNRFILLAGLRQEWFQDLTNYKAANELAFRNSKLLPRLGLTYELSSNVNVYATYLEGYQPQSNTVTLLPSTGAYFWTDQSAARFKPLISDLKEAGVKTSWLKNKVHINLAVYQINQKNLLLNANLSDYPDSLVTRGAERSRGAELDITGYILPHWQVYASYSYIDARIMIDNNPALIGSRKQNTPFNSGNLWTRYNFRRGKLLRDIGVGIGIQHSGNRVPWFDRSFTTPAYTLLDLALYYTPGDMKLALNLNNALDKTYWIGAQNYQRLFPGAPRNLILSASYLF